MKIRADPCIAQVADWLAQQGRALTADYEEAQRFLQALDPTASVFSFRTFSDTPYTRLPGKDPLQRAIHGTLAGCWDALLALNRRGAAISVTINRTHGRGRAIRDIQRVRALFLDDDHPPRSLDRFALPPHIQVRTSPGRYHHYWLVSDLPLGCFCGLQRRLAARYAGDHRILALNQSMQLPGFWRRKGATRALLPDIHRLNPGAPYRWRTLEEHLLSAVAACPARSGHPAH